MRLPLDWFPFYAGDFLRSPRVVSMNMTERGIYTTLLAFQWAEGAVPSSTEELAALLTMNRRDFERAWGRVRKAFEPCANDKTKLCNARLEIIRAEQLAKYHAGHEQRVLAGRKSGESRRAQAKARSTDAELPLNDRSTGAERNRTELDRELDRDGSPRPNGLVEPNLRAAYSARVRAERPPRRPDDLASTWPEPDDVESLRVMARAFVIEFANVKDPVKMGVHVKAYTNVLAAMRGRGVTVAHAWGAFHALRRVLDAPVFNVRAKETLMHLQPVRR